MQVFSVSQSVSAAACSLLSESCGMDACVPAWGRGVHRARAATFGRPPHQKRTAESRRMTAVTHRPRQTDARC